MGQRVRWGLELLLAQEGPPLPPLTEAPIEIEENGATLAQEDGAMVEDDAIAD